jgi:hypothetical protein
VSRHANCEGQMALDFDRWACAGGAALDRRRRSAGPDRGRCPTCGISIIVNPNGTVAEHEAPR